MWLKFCSISWNLQIIPITHTFWFFRRLKRVGSVLSRSELEPFLFIHVWYHTVWAQSGISSCDNINNNTCMCLIAFIINMHSSTGVVVRRKRIYHHHCELSRLFVRLRCHEDLCDINKKETPPPPQKKNHQRVYFKKSLRCKNVISGHKPGYTNTNLYKKSLPTFLLRLRLYGINHFTQKQSTKS